MGEGGSRHFTIEKHKKQFLYDFLHDFVLSLRESELSLNSKVEKHCEIVISSIWVDIADNISFQAEER